MKTQPIEINEHIYSVAELNGCARVALEDALGKVWVMGEISNLARPSSGHLYFSLKDSDAQVRCALFRSSRCAMDFSPENGQQVLTQATVSLYEGRGDYQLIISKMQLAGSGALQIAFEQLKKTLHQQGLFDEAHKKPIPPFPKQIGVITSSTGAAVHDIIKVLHRRSPHTPIIIYPTSVQGDQAKNQIVSAIETANQRHECDVLIVARGGGSLEDLWPFNEACVAQAIFNSDIPIVTGIGHEVDITIADFVADHRAPTPSAAAALVSIDQKTLAQQFMQLEQQLTRQIQHQLRHYQQQLHHLQKRLRHPRDLLREQTQTLDQIEAQLALLIKNKLLKAQSALGSVAAKLHALSPLATLERGFAILTDAQHNVIHSVTQVSRGDTLSAKLKDGSLLLIAGLEPD